VKWRVPCLLAFLAVLGAPAMAGAFCRARTCDPADPKQQCATDADDCVTSGRQLFWGTSCLTFAVHEDGSPKRGIDADTLTNVTAEAFAPWLRADCAGAPPSLEVGILGPVACAESGFNENARNANIVMFRDDVWPYPGSLDAFALTVVSYDPATGKIVDADIEINSADFNVTTQPDPLGVDLQTILTHEAGHFLGLSHTAPENTEATMRVAWNGRGTDLRTLEPDDVAGLCDAFPPHRKAPRTCEPVNGFGSGCNEPKAEEDDGGCSLALHRNSTPTSAWAWLFVLVALARRNRRR
jgi:hypothetical protein